MCPHRVTCTRCGQETGETEEQINVAPQPCPRCGSGEKTVHVVARDDIKLGVKEWTRVKAKDDRFRREDKLRRDFVSGDELHLKSGKWYKKERIIDRDSDTYKEVVSDPSTGEEKHHCEEPLSDHKGHGSANKKRGGSP